MLCRFIIVSGLIGVGKTTFTTSLAQHLGYESYFEPVEENPYLADFYDDPNEWAYVMQEHIKNMRFAAHQSAVWSIRSGRTPGVIMDRSIYEDTVFAEINRDTGSIKPRKFETYLQNFSTMSHFLSEPDCIIYLDAPPEVCKMRAELRDRPEERGGISLDYLQMLRDGYERWIDKVSSRIPVVRVPWTEYRPTPVVWSAVLDKIEERNRFTRSIAIQPSAI